MLMRLINASASFQDLVNSVLRLYLDYFCVIYLDDILIFSEIEEDHITHVTKVLEAFEKHHLYAKLEKCVFHASEIEFLDYIVERHDVRMNSAKIEAVAS